MIIQRILTNNAVVILNESGKEEIVCGKGIAFKKRPGEEIDATLINQTFVLMSDSPVLLQLEQVLRDIPLKYVELSNEIVKMVRITMEVQLSDSLIISLADHIFEAVKRYEKGIVLSNNLIWEVQRFYETEYEVGLLAKHMVEKAFEIELPDDEAAYIAMHIVNAKTDGSTIDEVVKMTKIIEEITSIVRMYFGIDFDEKSGYYYRFITHLKYFARRVLQKEQFTEDVNRDLADIIFEKYNEAYKCSCKIGEFLNSKWNYQISDEEIMYITIHIHTVVSKRSKLRKGDSK